MRSRYRVSQFNAWLIPLLYAAGALLFGFTTPRLAYKLLPGFLSSISASAAIGIYSAVASGMLTLTGIVFSLTFVMVQFSATAYSPRLVLWVARDPVMSHAIGIFTATFLYALASLAWVDRYGTGRVPIVGMGVVTVLLIVSIAMFVALIQRVRMLQVTQMLIFTGDQGREIIETIYPTIDARPCTAPPDIFEIPCSQTLFHRGKPRILQAIDIPALLEIACKGECVLEVTAEVGDAVHDSTPIIRVFGASGPVAEAAVRDAIQLGNERTFEQDPKYAIRLLVDIAIKALSPAVNDPTTAVQALDQIEDLLIRLGRRRLEIGAYRDSGGKLRLLVAFPAWDDFLRLAFDEIRVYGATSIQVTRRMSALLSELLSVLPEERRPELRHWQERLRTTVERTFTDKQDVLDACDEDRQGLGSSRRLTRSPLS
jgi:uncharacterized membrane protein